MARDVNSYEEARRKRLQENLKKIEGLGITAIKESLSESAKHKAKKYCPSPVSKKSFAFVEVRRSSRARNIVTSYQEEFADSERQARSYKRKGHGKRTYNGAVVSYEERIQAITRAEKFQHKLGSANPSFVKSMVRSHVSSCFWLGLPSRFCKDHLPVEEVNMVIEDENGDEYGVVYIGSRAGLSGGWRGFALDHELDDGDALVFELVESDRFKVYIFKAADHPDLYEDDNGDNDAKANDNDATDLEKGTGKPMDELKSGHAADHQETPSQIKCFKRRGKRPATEADSTAKSATKAGDKIAPHIQEPLTTSASSNHRSETELKKNNETADAPEAEVKSSTETEVDDSVASQKLTVTNAKSRGRVKRTPRRSGI